MEKSLGLPFTLEIPVLEGFILLDFWSGNVLFFKDKKLINIEKHDEIFQKLSSLVCCKQKTENYEKLITKWFEIYKNIISLCIFFDINSKNEILEKDFEKIFEYILNEEKYFRNLIFGFFLKKKKDIEFLFEIFSHQRYLNLFHKKDLNIYLMFINPGLFSKHDNFFDDFQNLTKFVKNPLKIHAAFFISSNNDIFLLFEIMRKLRQNYNFNVSIYYTYDSIEELKKLEDIILKHQLYSIISSFYLVPYNYDIYSLIYFCMHKINLEIYNKTFSFLLNEKMEKIFQISGNGVLNSIQNFLKTELYFPPNLIRCGAGTTLLFKGNKTYLCYNDYGKNDYIDLKSNNFVNLLTQKVKKYKNSQILFSNKYKDCYFTYGGKCPYMNEKGSKEKVTELIKSFFECYISIKKT